LLRYGLGDDAHATNAFTLALTELVARQALILRGAWVRRRWAPGKYATFLLCEGPRMDSVEERSLRPVVDLHAGIEGRTLGVPFEDSRGAVQGVLLTSFATLAARHYGGFSRYLERDVAGSLRERGLLTALNVRSSAGNRAYDQLDAWIEVTRGALFRWSHDETWLRAYLGGAGAAVFLSQFATPGQPVLKHISYAVAAFPAPEWSHQAAIWDSNGLDFAGLAHSLDGTFAVFGAGLGGGGGGGDGGGGG
jgi:hypothetical protein